MLQQVDTPQKLYSHPANLFVAAFIGSPPMNLVEARGRRRDGLLRAASQIPLASEADLSAYEGRDVILGIRPSDLEDTSVWRNDRLPTLEVTAEVTEELGSEVNVMFGVDAPPVAAEVIGAASDESVDEEAFLFGGRRAVFCARVDARTHVRPGGKIRLSVDPARFHFFDPSTGLAVGAEKPAAAPA